MLEIAESNSKIGNNSARLIIATLIINIAKLVAITLIILIIATSLKLITLIILIIATPLKRNTYKAIRSCAASNAS